MPLVSHPPNTTAIQHRNSFMKNSEINISKKELIKKYIYNSETLKQISEYLKCSEHAVAKMLNEYDIPIRKQETFPLSKDFLQREYVEKSRSASDIAIQIGCTPKTIVNKLRQYCIEIRRLKYKISKELIYDLYINQDKTIEKISIELECSESTVSRTLKKFNIQIKKIKTSISDDFLINEYINNKKSTADIACAIGHSSDGVRRRLMTLGVKIRPLYDKKQDLSGQKTGKLTIINKCGKINGRNFWNCECECGNKCSFSVGELSKRKSCGKKCKLKNKCENSGEITMKDFGRIRYGAKKRNLIFDITMEQMWSTFVMQNGKCAISGVSLIFDKKNILGDASLDRIDSDKGYTVDNIQWVHKDLNKMKLDMPEKEFFEWINTIYHFKSNQNYDYSI